MESGLQLKDYGRSTQVFQRLLHDEFLAAIPTLSPVPNAQDESEPVIKVEGLASNIWSTVPNDADETAVAAVVLAHDPANRQPDLSFDRRSRITELLAVGRSNWTASQQNELI